VPYLIVWFVFTNGPSPYRQKMSNEPEIHQRTQVDATVWMARKGALRWLVPVSDDHYNLGFLPAPAGVFC
jgi:hypothetical protein